MPFLLLPAILSSDILIPTAQNNENWLNDAALHSGCPISKLPWESKVGQWRSDVLFAVLWGSCACAKVTLLPLAAT
jgi:hypothetical protein